LIPALYQKIKDLETENFHPKTQLSDLQDKKNNQPVISSGITVKVNTTKDSNDASLHFKKRR
jgi:hypothetical protein